MESAQLSFFRSRMSTPNLHPLCRTILLSHNPVVLAELVIDILRKVSVAKMTLLTAVGSSNMTI